MATAGDEHYPLDSILFLEEMWGDGFLSPGGPEEVERLLSGVDLEGRTVVDIGSGAGGVPILLADRYGAARVIGLDVEATMVAHARAKVERAGLQGRIEIRMVDQARCRCRTPASTSCSARTRSSTSRTRRRWPPTRSGC